MNIDFNILWIEDDVDWLESVIDQVEEVVNSFNLSLKYIRKEGDDVDTSSLSSLDYDLILMDYKLTNGRFGDELIDEIRKQNILTDILFYSSDTSALRKALEKNSLQGIYLADRPADIFASKIKNLVCKIVRRSQSIENLRGTVMDNTSEFEQYLKEILTIVWVKLNDEDQIGLNQYAKTSILSKAKKSHEDIFKKYIESEAPFFESISAKGYILDSEKKARMLNKVLEILISKYSLISDDISVNFFNNFKKDIIDERNKLAHIRKTYDKNCFVITCEGQEVTVDEDYHKKMRASNGHFDRCAITNSKVDDA